MAITATSNVQVTVSGGGYQATSTGPLYVDSQVNATGNPPGSASLVANTFQAVAIPATATAVTIVPPVGNTGTLTLKGVTGDTGLALGAIVNATKILFVAGAMSTLGMLSNTTGVWGLIWG